jgi:hypothetical protein
MADSVLLQLRSQVRDYENRIAQYEQERKVYEARIIDLERQVKTYQKRRASFRPTVKPQRKKQAPRWIAAGDRIIEDIESAILDLGLLQIQDVIPLQLGGTLFLRGTELVQRAAGSIHNSKHVTRIARLELFYCLTTIWVLNKEKAFVNDELHELMNTLDSESHSRDHQKRSLKGAAWFHEYVIAKLCEMGWSLGCAIAAVALRRLILLRVETRG